MRKKSLSVLVTCMVWQAWLPLFVRMAETACRILPVSPQDTTRLKRQAQDRAVMACPVGSLGPVLRTVVSNSSWKSDSERGTKTHGEKSQTSPGQNCAHVGITPHSLTSGLRADLFICEHR